MGGFEVTGSKAGRLMVAKFIDFAIKEQYMHDFFAVEVPFALQKRRADLISVGKNIIAYEFKSDRDKLDNLVEQLADYNKCFHQIYIVIAPKHLSMARDIIGRRVGIIVHKDNDFIIIRKAISRDKLDKISILNSMPVHYLRKIVPSSKSLAGDELRNIIFSKISLDKVTIYWKKFLAISYQNNYTAFISERGERTHTEDLRRISTTNKLFISG